MRRRRLIGLAFAIVAAAYVAVVIVLGARPAEFPEQGSEREQRECAERFERSKDADAAVDRMRRATGGDVEVMSIGADGGCYYAIGRPELSYAYALVLDDGVIRPTGSGCGEGQARTLIPDLWFTEACDEHDVCYAFGADGERASRRACDRRMREVSLDACTEDAPWLVRPACRGAAWAYWAGVRTFGRWFYLEA